MHLCCLLVCCGFLLYCATTAGEEQADSPPGRQANSRAGQAALPPPYVFALGGLTYNEVEGLKTVPGVLDVTPTGNRIRVVWQPWRLGPGNEGLVRVKRAIAIASYLVPSGFECRAMSGGRAGTIIRDTRGGRMFGIEHPRVRVRLHCYSEALPGQVEHEMLRDVAGTDVRVEKCGDGYVVVSAAGRGKLVVWQVSDQAFCRMDNAREIESIAPLVRRLGSIIPGDYKVSVDRWVLNEIRWRIAKLDQMHQWRLDRNHGESLLWANANDVTRAFPAALKLEPRLTTQSSITDEWRYLHIVRRWLWANRGNFQYDDRSRGYVLKAGDLYDPDNPPGLPKELRGPPRPTEEQIRAAAEASRRAELEEVEKAIRLQVAEWDRYYASWLSTRRGRVGLFVRRSFPDLQKLIGTAKASADPQEVRTWLQTAREWLWANRENLQRESTRYVFRLKGPDLYDPENPPELPEDLRGPLKPQRGPQPE